MIALMLLGLQKEEVPLAHEAGHAVFPHYKAMGISKSLRSIFGKPKKIRSSSGMSLSAANGSINSLNHL